MAVATSAATAASSAIAKPAASSRSYFSFNKVFFLCVCFLLRGFLETQRFATGAETHVGSTATTTTTSCCT
jgi:hypothetical protein